jgi:hypothetical protein
MAMVKLTAAANAIRKRRERFFIMPGYYGVPPASDVA